jgi:putative transposase
MPRPQRIEYPGAWYHVMNNARKDEKLFFNPTDYETFIRLLQETGEKLNVKIAAYCLMPSQYHLLVHTPDGNLSQCMRHINGLYTRRFNRHHIMNGPIFRGRYKPVLIEPDSHLLDVLRYIHRTPLREGYGKKLHDYLWCSHQGYISNAKKWRWLHKDNLLSIFCANDHNRKTAYRDFVSWNDSKQIRHFYSLKNLPPVLGSTFFKKSVKDKLIDLSNSKEVSRSSTLAPTTKYCNISNSPKL